LDFIGSLTAGGTVDAQNGRFTPSVASVPARNPHAALADLGLVVVATAVAFGAAFLTESSGVLPKREKIQFLTRPGGAIVLVAIDALGRTDWRA
jgi:hypothetical protein